MSELFFFHNKTVLSIDILFISIYMNTTSGVCRQFTRAFLAADFVLAGKSASGRHEEARHFMSKNELRSSGEHRMRFMTIDVRGACILLYANGAGELWLPLQNTCTRVLLFAAAQVYWK